MTRRRTGGSALLLLPFLAASCAGPRDSAPAIRRPPDTRPLLCAEPAVTGLKVVNARWPDCSTVAQFARDAVRLEGAKTEEEKAIAVWHWTRRMMQFPADHEPPVDRAGRYVLDPILLLNTYGVHWCDGQARVMQTGMRRLGLRAFKLYKAGHTLCDVGWRDPDGVRRMHVFDVSEGWFVRTRDGSRIASSEDIARDHSLVYRPAYGRRLWHDNARWMSGWVHTQHLEIDSGHRVELAMRRGESVRRLWGNVGKPFHDCAHPKRKHKRRWEFGPYPHRYGNAVWTFAAELTAAGLARQCATPPVNVTAAGGSARPTDAGTPAQLVYRIRAPNAMSSMGLTPAGTLPDVTVELSVDDGENWRSFRPQDGRWDLAPPFELTRSRSRHKKRDRPISAFGCHDVLVRLTLRGAWSLTGLTAETTTQHNVMALPALLPGDNPITISGSLRPDAAVRVTCIWDDAAGGRRKNVTVATGLPFTYTVRAAGRRWKDVVCRELLIETIPADGLRSGTLVKEAPTPVKADDPLPGPDRVLGTEPLPPLGSVDEYAKLLRTSTDEDELRYTLADVRVLGDPEAYGAVRHVAMTSLKHSKLQALQTMYWLDRERALADFLKILGGNEPAIRWRSDPKNPLVERAARYAAASQMSCFLADEQATEALPLLTDVLREMYKRPAANVRGWATFRWGVLRSFCRFDDPAIKPALRTMFKSPASRWRFNGLEIAFRGAARVGDRSFLPLMRQHVPTGYTPLRTSAIHALGRLDDRESMDLIRRYIDRGDEEGRAAAAEVAGRFRDRKAVPLLEKRLERDTYPWVREKIREALRRIRRED